MNLYENNAIKMEIWDAIFFLNVILVG